MSAHGTPALDADAAKLEAMGADAGLTLADIAPRCPRCGWLFAESADKGCVPGNCSCRCEPYPNCPCGPQPTTQSARDNPQSPFSTFQPRVNAWMQACFGPAIAADQTERNHRFFEEATETVQSLGMTASEAHQLVDYVFGRPTGEPAQEIGGVMVTLAALCQAANLYMDEAGEIELARVWTKIEQIRAKQAEKPKHSPLPAAADPLNAPAPSPPDTFAAGLEAAARWHDREAAVADKKARGLRVMTNPWGEQVDALGRHLKFAAAIRALAGREKS